MPRSPSKRTPAANNTFIKKAIFRQLARLSQRLGLPADNPLHLSADWHPALQRYMQQLQVMLEASDIIQLPALDDTPLTQGSLQKNIKAWNKTLSKSNKKFGQERRRQTWVTQLKDFTTDDDALTTLLLIEAIALAEEAHNPTATHAEALSSSSPNDTAETETEASVPDNEEPSAAAEPAAAAAPPAKNTRTPLPTFVENALCGKLRPLFHASKDLSNDFLLNAFSFLPEPCLTLFIEVLKTSKDTTQDGETLPFIFPLPLLGEVLQSILHAIEGIPMQAGLSAQSVFGRDMSYIPFLKKLSKEQFSTVSNDRPPVSALSEFITACDTLREHPIRKHLKMSSDGRALLAIPALPATQRHEASSLISRFTAVATQLTTFQNECARFSYAVAPVSESPADDAGAVPETDATTPAAAPSTPPPPKKRQKSGFVPKAPFSPGFAAIAAHSVAKRAVRGGSSSLGAAVSALHFSKILAQMPGSPQTLAARPAVTGESSEAAGVAALAATAPAAGSAAQPAKADKASGAAEPTAEAGEAGAKLPTETAGTPAAGGAAQPAKADEASGAAQPTAEADEAGTKLPTEAAGTPAAGGAAQPAKADEASGAAEPAKADEASGAAEPAKADEASGPEAPAAGSAAGVAAQPAKADEASGAAEPAKADEASGAAEPAKADEASGAAEPAKADEASGPEAPAAGSAAGVAAQPAGAPATKRPIGGVAALPGFSLNKGMPSPVTSAVGAADAPNSPAPITPSTTAPNTPSPQASSTGDSPPPTSTPIPGAGVGGLNDFRPPTDGLHTDVQPGRDPLSTDNASGAAEPTTEADDAGTERPTAAPEASNAPTDGVAAGGAQTPPAKPPRRQRRDPERQPRTRRQRRDPERQPRTRRRVRHTEETSGHVDDAAPLAPIKLPADTLVTELSRVPDKTSGFGWFQKTEKDSHADLLQEALHLIPEAQKAGVECAPFFAAYYEALANHATTKIKSSSGTFRNTLSSQYTALPKSDSVPMKTMARLLIDNPSSEIVLCYVAVCLMQPDPNTYSVEGYTQACDSKSASLTDPLRHWEDSDKEELTQAMDAATNAVAQQTAYRALFNR